uniref:U19-Hexatoxin-Hc1a_1 n=1 Tax=Hadronyche cerberea TaxID=1107879 RepID=A0A4V2H8P1_HADCE
MKLAILICLTLMVNTFVQGCLTEYGCGRNECCRFWCIARPGEGEYCGIFGSICHRCKSGFRCTNIWIGTCVSSSPNTTSTAGTTTTTPRP